MPVKVFEPVVPIQGWFVDGLDVSGLRIRELVSSPGFCSFADNFVSVKLVKNEFGPSP